MSSPTPSPATKKLRECSPRPFQLPPFPESSSPAGSVSSASPAWSPAVSSGPSSAHAGSLASASPARSPAVSLASLSRSPALSSVSPAQSPAVSSVPSTPALSGAPGSRRRIPFLAPLPVPIASYPTPQRPLMVEVQCIHCKTERAIFAALPCGHRLFCIHCRERIMILGTTIKCLRLGLAIEGWKQAAWENAAAADPQGAQQQGCRGTEEEFCCFGVAGCRRTEEVAKPVV